MTRQEYTFPDVGEGVAEGDLLKWYVTEGEQVEEDQVLAEVETDKAVVDIPSPVDATIAELLYDEGDTIPVGETFVVFELDEGESVAGEETAEAGGAESGGAADEQEQSATSEVATETAEATRSRSFAPPRVRRLAREHGIDVETIEGSGAGGRVTETDVKAAAGLISESTPEPTSASEQTSASEPASAPETTEEPAETSTTTDASGRKSAVRRTSGETAEEAAGRDQTLATPATRRVAHELDVDIDDVPAVSQRDGEAFVTTEAVQEYAEGGTQPTDVESAASAAADAETETRVEERVPYRGVRRTIGEQMERSKSTIPHVSTVDEADVTELVDMREELAEAADEQGVNLTYLSFVVMAIGRALQEFPYVNSELDMENDEIVLKNYYNIGIATEAQDGLRVPVVKDVDEKGLLEIASDITEVVQRARDGSISRDEMQNGTFTVTNIGPYGGQHGTPIINYPEVAILAMGEITEKPRVVDGEIVPRHVMNLSMSFDHRVLDGATAQQFLNAVEEYLEQPELLLLE